MVVMNREAEKQRITNETQIRVELNLDGAGKHQIDTGIAFFDHMLTLFTVHGFFDLIVEAGGDLDVDFHHTVEDVGLVLGDAFSDALGDRAGIRRYGHAVTPMDETLSAVSVDLSNRPYLVFHVPVSLGSGADFDLSLTKEFFRAFSNRCGVNLHINVHYGENRHHIIESLFKGAGRALGQAVSREKRVAGVRSSKGSI
jgi:imidazoleglycerol-phosphate dehydratase